MPPTIKTQDQQIEVCRESVRRFQEDLNKFTYLSELQVRTLYYFQFESLNWTTEIWNDKFKERKEKKKNVASLSHKIMEW